MRESGQEYGEQQGQDQRREGGTSKGGKRERVNGARERQEG